MSTRSRLQLICAAAGSVAAGVSVHAADVTRIPLCPGLTVVTAINQSTGDYESIKTLESVTTSEIRLKYSAEMLNTDLFGGEPLRKVLVHRNVLTADMRDAKIYEQIFLQKSAETFPGTTAIGVSAAVLGALKTKGQTDLSLSNAYAGVELTADLNVRPNYRDFLQPGTLKRVGSGTVPFRVLLNDQPVDLPAIKAEGDFVGEKAEFFLLDDERNPLTLAFRLGIGAVKPLEGSQLSFCETLRKNGAEPGLLASNHCDRPNGGDRDALRVIKITSRCAGAPQAPAGGPGQGAGTPPGGSAPAPAGGNGGAGGASAMEQALANSGKFDVYSIYFSFNSDVIRDESEPTLREIAEVLKRHPDWKLRVSGHTDAIGGDQYNLDLSKRRAAAVKDALVKRYKVDAMRLTTGGFGRSQPKDANDTLEGRARNRRVELMRG